MAHEQSARLDSVSFINDGYEHHVMRNFVAKSNSQECFFLHHTTGDLLLHIFSFVHTEVIPTRSDSRGENVVSIT